MDYLPCTCLKRAGQDHFGAFKYYGTFFSASDEEGPKEDENLLDDNNRLSDDDNDDGAPDSVDFGTSKATVMQQFRQVHCPNMPIQLFHTFLCNSQNYHPRGAVDDPMHCCPRPKAEGNSASGHPQHRGVIVLTVAQKGMK